MRAKFITACGCESIKNIPAAHPTIEIAIENHWREHTRAYTDKDLFTRTTFTVRRFDLEPRYRSQFERDMDPFGDREELTYREILDRNDNAIWERKYRELYQEVFGMDVGL